MKEGSVGLADNEFYQSLMTEDARKTVEELKEKVISGEVKVTETMGLSTDELAEIRDSVRP